jgi:hypothetical protein
MYFSILQFFIFLQRKMEIVVCITYEVMVWIVFCNTHNIAVGSLWMMMIKDDD